MQVTDSEKYGQDLREMTSINSVGVVDQLYGRRIMTADILENLVTLKQFNGTVFEEQPLFLRELMELRLERLEFLEEGALFFYSLTYPIIRKGFLVPKFSVLQTGFYNESNHLMMDLPEELALIDGHIVEFECIHTIFGLCRVDPNSERESCLSPSATSACSLRKADSGETCTVNTRHGVMITSRGQINAFTSDFVTGKATNTNRRLVAIQKSSSRSYFLPWGNYSEVHINGYGSGILPPTYLIDRNFIFTSMSDYFNLSLMEFDDVITIKSHLNVLDDLIQEQKRNIKNISQKVEVIGGQPGGPSFFTILSLGLHTLQIFFIIYIVIRIISCCKKRRRYQRADDQTEYL